MKTYIKISPAGLYLLACVLFSSTCLLSTGIPGFNNIQNLLTQHSARKIKSLQDPNAEELYQKICHKWHLQCLKKVSSPCAVLPAKIVKRDGVEYRLFGYTHGVTQIQAGSYDDFVRNAFNNELKSMDQSSKKAVDVIFAEENLTRDLLDPRLKLNRGSIFEVSDHLINNEAALKNEAFRALTPKKGGKKRVAVSQATSTIAMDGLRYVYRSITSLTNSEYEMSLSSEAIEIWDVPTQFSGDFSDGFLQETNEAQLLESQKLDIQLGLSHELPSHLQMEYDLNEWLEDQEQSAYGEEVVSTDQVFERSLFMAGVVKEYAKRYGAKKLSFFIGGWHLKHIFEILKDDALVKDCWPYQLGRDLVDTSRLMKKAKSSSKKRPRR